MKSEKGNEGLLLGDVGTGWAVGVTKSKEQIVTCEVRSWWEVTEKHRHHPRLCL